MHSASSFSLFLVGNQTKRKTGVVRFPSGNWQRGKHEEALRQQIMSIFVINFLNTRKACDVIQCTKAHDQFVRL